MIGNNRPAWYTDVNLDAAIGILNRSISVYRSGNGQGFVWVELKEEVIFSCYFSPNAVLGDLEQALGELEDAMREEGRRSGKEIIVAGDFNARAPEWGMEYTDRRGNLVIDWMARNDLQVVNEGSTFTFVRGEGGSIPDITLATAGAARGIKGWRVLQEEETLSDHRYIGYEVGRQERPPVIRGRGWKLGLLDREAFKRSLREHMGGGAVTADETLIRVVSRACDEAMPRRRTARAKGQVYWWTDEINNLKAECIAARRRGVRGNRRQGAQGENLALQEYREARKRLRDAIKNSKREKWRKVCEDIDRDVWGDGYKIVTRRMGVTPPAIPAERIEEIVGALFPDREEVRWRVTEVLEVPLFTEEELKAACNRLKSGKAPGPDNIPPEIVKMVVEEHPGVILGVMNRALENGVFPERWRKARLVLIAKGNKPPEEPSSYRPVCLLDAWSKLLEYLLLGRLEAEIEQKGGLADSQYGFRKGRSTVDAVRRITEIAREAMNSKKLCAVVTLDVRNAFNTAGWTEIVGRLRRLGVAPYLLRLIESYFENRRIGWEAEDTAHWRKVTCGVPQGSVLGPTLWNLMFNDILQLPLPDGVTVTGYADDLAIAATGSQAADVEEEVNGIIRRMERWLRGVQLELAPEKTECVIVTRKRNLPPFTVRVGQVEIGPSRGLKYLGIWLDPRLTYGLHALKTAEKAGKAASALGRLMCNTNGPKASKRRVLCGVVHSILLYAAPIWEGALEVQATRSRLERVQRGAALRVCSAYRTVSYEAVLVVAGVPPLKLLAKERREVYEGVGKQEAKDRLFRRWQTRWNDSTKGRWTRRLIPNIRAWVERAHGEVSFHLTQALTGHGSFAEYLYDIGKIGNRECVYCGENDNAEHTVFHCNRWRTERGGGDHWSPDSLTRYMLESEGNWERIADAINRIMRTKEADEREQPLNRLDGWGM